MPKIYKSQHLSRLLAVQTLYAFFIQDKKKDLISIANELLKNHQKNELNDDFNHELEKNNNLIDEYFFNTIINEFVNSELDQETLISKYLKTGWNYEKLDLILKCILSFAVFEIQFFGSIPIKIIIDEYVTITRSFYGKTEIGFVNAVLDSIAKEIRPDEFKDTKLKTPN